MSRSINIHLSLKNILLLLGGLAAFGGAVAFGVRTFDAAPDERAHEGHEEAPGDSHEGHGHEAHAEHEKGTHGEGKHEEGQDEEGEHKEGRVMLSPEALKNAEITLATAGPGTVNVTLSLPGEVSFNQDTLAHVTPRVSGAAREVKRQVGELVKKGDVLAILDSRDLADAQRDFLATKERLTLAEATFARATQLKQENVSAEKDFLAAKQTLAEAKIEHRSAAQKLQAIGGGAGAGGGGYALVAPFAGTIVDKHISVGEVLTDATRAFTIADLSTIWVNVTVYAKDLARVTAGQQVEVRAEGIAEPAQGTIAYLGQVVGEKTRSATARVVLKNPGAAWRPGLFATAEIAIESVSVPVVARDEALQTVDGKDVIFVLEAGAFEAVPVTLGRKGTSTDRTVGAVVEVLLGLTAGRQYVAKNSFILKAELGKSEAGHEH
ncbi:MAG: hypothetical protein RJA70_3856 [Pseudomonadota bacterium]|jgi:cobalt-zinc-cadmium efflux system membrane fusion protein